jgi:tetratricopeptide (TPR) repeat protein
VTVVIVFVGGGANAYRLSWCTGRPLPHGGRPGSCRGRLVNGCREEDDPHIRLAYCTKLIESGKSVGEAKAWAFIARGDAFLEDEQYEQAIDSYNEAIRLKPGDAEAWVNRGLAYGYSGETDKAINDYDAAIRLDPKDVRALNNRGWAYRTKAKYDLALQDLNLAIKLEPDYARA